MQFRLFLRKATLFIVTLALCDFLVGSALRYFYFRIEQGPFARTTYAVNTMKKDLLIFGSSRAENHYSSEILEREWGPSFYNLGAPGQAIFYHLGILRAVLARYSPKVIILNADTYDFDASRESYDRLSSLLPYFRSHKEMRSIISLRSKFEELKLVSQIYPFNSMILTIIEGNLGPIDIDDRGYKPLTGVWKEPLAHRDFHDTTMDQEKSAAFQSFLSEATRSGARVFVVAPPIYQIMDSPNPFLNRARTIAGENNVRFLNYEQEAIFLKDSQLFQDPLHLNDSGAKIFTKMVIAAVK